MSNYSMEIYRRDKAVPCLYNIFPNPDYRLPHTKIPRSKRHGVLLCMINKNYLAPSWGRIASNSTSKTRVE